MQQEFVISKQAQMRGARSLRANGSNLKDLSVGDLAMLSLTPVIRSIHHWWLQRAEQHYLICANVEEQRAREAQANVAYYQKRAALARSARL
jgi:hypothetical protein